MSDLNKLYSPSAWVTRCSPSQVVDEHGEFGKKCNQWLIFVSEIACRKFDFVAIC